MRTTKEKPNVLAQFYNVDVNVETLQTILQDPRMSSVIGQKKKGKKLTLIYPFKPNGLADEPFAKFRAADGIFHFFSNG